MEAAVQFADRRLEERLEVVASKHIMSTEPLVECLSELLRIRREIETFAGVPATALDELVTRVLRAAEKGSDHLGWVPVSEGALMVNRTDDTVREWIRQEKVKARPGANGQVVLVKSLLRHAGMIA